MTEAETKVLEHLAAAWNEFIMLPVQHRDDNIDMRRAIHAAQRIVMSRPTVRELQADTQ